MDAAELDQLQRHIRAMKLALANADKDLQFDATEDPAEMLSRLLRAARATTVLREYIAYLLRAASLLEKKQRLASEGKQVTQ
jgi:hypothetical protein